MTKLMKIPDAHATVDKEWEDKFKNLQAANASKVREKEDVRTGMTQQFFWKDIYMAVHWQACYGPETGKSRTVVKSTSNHS